MLKFWFNNCRPKSLPQSLTPALLAAVMALGPGFCWWTALLAIVGVALAHLSLNLADDYFDYMVDMRGDRDRVIRKGFRAVSVKYPYLADGSTDIAQTGRAVAVIGLSALVCAVPIFIRATVINGFCSIHGGSWCLLVIVGLCAFLGMFYSAPPFKFGYKGFGELIIGLIFGPLLMTGVYYSACGRVDSAVVFVSIPVGLLVMNILFVHSVIDLPADEESNKMTFARVIGSNCGNVIAEGVILALPFLSVIAAVVAFGVHPLYLITLLMVPRALWLFRSILFFTKGREIDTRRPPKFLGSMGNWEEICRAGMDWFLIRWLTARNILSDFCLLVIIAKVLILIF